MQRTKPYQNGFVAVIGLVITAVLLLILFVIITRGSAIKDPDNEATVQNPDKYQQEVDVSLSKAAERNEELYEIDHSD